MLRHYNLGHKCYMVYITYFSKTRHDFNVRKIANYILIQQYNNVIPARKV